MKRILYPLIIFLGLMGTTQAQGIPKKLWGKWIVRREVPTTTLSCWSEDQAKTLIGTEVENSDGLFR